MNGKFMKRLNILRGQYSSNLSTESMKLLPKSWLPFFAEIENVKLKFISKSINKLLNIAKTILKKNSHFKFFKLTIKLYQDSIIPV